MKKDSLLLLCFIFLFTTVQGQSLKGSLYIDGQANFSKKNEVFKGASSASDETQRIIGFNPNIGYTISNRFLVGLGVNFQQTKTDGLTLHSTTIIKKLLTSKSIEPSVFLKYLKPINSRLIFSLKLNLYYGKLYLEQNIQSNTAGGTFFKSENKYHGASFSPELLFLLTKKIGLHVNFRGLNVVKTEVLPGGLITEYDFNLNPSNWKFGVFVLLGKGSVNLQKTKTD